MSSMARTIDSTTIRTTVDMESTINEVVARFKEKNVYKNVINDFIFRVRYGYNSNIYNKLNHIFNNGDTFCDRITVDIDKVKNDGKSCQYYESVKDLLDKLDYTIKDYVAGICTKKDDSREFKIGKILSANKATKKVIDGFANSPVRSSSKNGKVITISRNPVDIILMSTLRGWTSCMNIERGHSQYVSMDMMHGTLVAYVHDKTDSDIKNPSGRVLLKPAQYVNEDTQEVSFLYVAERSYGTVNTNAKKTINDIVNDLNHYIMVHDNILGYVSATIPNELYRDTISMNQNFFGTPENFDKFTYDFSIVKSDVLKNLIADLFENQLEALINPTTSKYVSTKLTMDSPTVEKIKPILEILNKNPKNEEVNDYIGRCIRYSRSKEKQSILAKAIMKSEFIIDRLNFDVIKFIIDTIGSSDVESLKGKSNIVDCYIDNTIIDKDYTASNKNYLTYDIVKSITIKKDSNLDKEIKSSALENNINAICAITKNYNTRTNSYISFVAENYDVFSLRMKIYMFKTIFDSNKTSSEIKEKIVKEISDKVGYEVTDKSLVCTSDTYKSIMDLLKNKETTTPIPMMIDGEMVEV